MTKEKNQNSYQVPLDVLIDITKIILQAELENEITAVNENKSIVEITINYQSDLNYHQKVISNIESILVDYKYFRFEEEDQTSWKEE